MEKNEKIEFWLKKLKLFSLNSDVQCSREEKALNQELIGTRHVSLAFKEMIKHMYNDLEIEDSNFDCKPVVLKNGIQVILFSVCSCNYYTDITPIHKFLKYPTRNYNQFAVSNLPMVGILNWYEGLVPVIKTSEIINIANADENYLFVYDIGKEIFAFIVSDVYDKQEIEVSSYGNDLTTEGRLFKYVDFGSFETSLIQNRLRMKL